MVASDLLNYSQYDSGVIGLVHCMARMLKHFDGRKHVIVVSDCNKIKNDFGDDKEFMFQSPSNKKASKDLEEINQFTHVNCFTKMKAMKTLGKYDVNDQTKAVPNYCIGAVVN